MGLTTPRIAPLPEAEWNEEVRELLPKGVRPLNIFTTLVRHPKLFKRWMVFGGHILSKSTLTPRDREILILRIGALCQSTYEFHQHTRIGRDAGLVDEEIARLQQARGDASGWNEREAILIRATDELHAQQMITDPTWQALRAHWNEKQLIDLLFTVGQYMMVSMVLNTLGVQIETKETP
jgi:4-carboxymuconolactone decarboxylase